MDRLEYEYLRLVDSTRKRKVKLRCEQQSIVHVVVIACSEQQNASMQNYCPQITQDFWRGLYKPREQELKSWMIKDNDIVNNAKKKPQKRVNK